ncbi:hypothetical protein M3Y99_00689900 [Aphelenchoides fujianensis]|nr:hypothetical protein M3Y99_00689900 [Aphelenchoides fujianensis]
MMEDEHLVRLKNEERRRQDHNRDLPLAWKKKRGGEATLGGPVRLPKGEGPFPLPRNAEVSCLSGDRYRVEGKINDRVYVVRALRSKRLYAMKVEWLTRDRSTKQMLREVFLLTDVDRHPDRFTRFFPRMQNKGRVANTFNFMNLNDVRAVYLKGCDFSRVDAARISMQAFQGIHDVHTLGFLHRTVQPSKFMLGINKPHMIYTMGFSRSYHFEARYETKQSTSPRKLPKLANRTFFDELYKHFLAIMHNLDKFNEKARPDYAFIGMTLMTVRRCFRRVDGEFGAAATSPPVKESIRFPLKGPFDFQKKAGKNATVEEAPEEAGGADAIVLMEAKDERTATATTGTSTTSAARSKKGPVRFTPPPPPPPPKPASQYRTAIIGGNPIIGAHRPLPGATPTYRPMPAGGAPPPPPPMGDPLQAEKQRLRNELDDLARRLDVAGASMNQAELDRLRAERDAALCKLQALNEGKSLAEAERLRQEKAALLAALAVLQAQQKNDALEKERREKEELEKKLAAALAAAGPGAEAERIKKEKEDLAKRLAEIEEQKKNDALQKERDEKERLAKQLEDVEAQKKRDEIERERAEKERLAKQLGDVEAQKKQAEIDRERKEKEELEAKLKAAKDAQEREALEREKREKEELQKKLREAEEQKAREAEEERQRQAKGIGEKKAMQSAYYG